MVLLMDEVAMYFFIQEKGHEKILFLTYEDIQKITYLDLAILHKKPYNCNLDFIFHLN